MEGQSHSLRLKAGDGQEYQFRAVDKDATSHLGAGLRRSLRLRFEAYGRGARFGGFTVLNMLIRL